MVIAVKKNAGTLSIFKLLDRNKYAEGARMKGGEGGVGLWEGTRRQRCGLEYGINPVLSRSVQSNPSIHPFSRDTAVLYIPGTCTREAPYRRNVNGVLFIT